MQETSPLALPIVTAHCLRHLVRVVAVLVPALAQGQSVAETIRGTVRSDSGPVVAAAAVSITRGPDRLVKQTVTDSAGRFSITFDTGTGDYLVSVSVVGYRSVRRRVQRQENERTLVADFLLTRDQASLAAVRVTADKPVRASATANPYNVETGVAEKWADGVDGQLPPTVAGDLNALAGTMPNATSGPLGISVLGSGPSSNLTTLNGMSLGTAQLPRAARTETRFTSATFDPTRGGFSGSNTDVRLSGGDRNYQQRSTFFTVDVPPLQFTDAVGRALGVRNQNLRFSGGLDGEAIRQVLTYNVAADYARVTSDPATLVGGDPLAFGLAGLAPDSVARLRSVAALRGIPLTGAGIPLQRERETFSALTRFDLTSDSTFARSLSSYVTSVHEGALGFGPTVAPAAGGSRREQTVGSILSLGKNFGVGLSSLNLTKLNVNRTRNESTPYLMLPAASVLLRAPAGANDGLVGVGLGGNAALAGTDTRWTIEGSNETVRNVRGSRHAVKGIVWGRLDGVNQTGGGDVLGRYTFNSLDDLAAGRAASFTRAITLPDREGRVWNAAMAVAHTYAPSRFFSVLYGLRLESNGFITEPNANPALATALGLRAALPSSRVHVSPRLGFTYSFNKRKGNGTGASMDQTGRYFRYPVGVLRGGIGEFRDLLQPGLVANAAARTGLPGSALSLTCAGAAVPVPAWDQFAADPATVPRTCANGSGPLGELAPNVSLVDPSYQVPRSWRASLDYNTAVKAFILRVGALASYDLNQPSAVDANFSGVPRFVLADEAGRPVFAPSAGIDPLTGAVSPAGARLANGFGSVLSRVSDLRGRGAQVTLSISGDPFERNHVLGPFRRSSVAYTLQQSRREFRGFDGAAFGDPRTREWAPSASDARHVITVQAALPTEHLGTFTLFGRFQSGLPFTPIVQGDVNGDGRGGDRAFVPHTSAITDATLRAGLEALAANGSASARNCLRASAGASPGLNTCRGPWSQTLNIMWRPPLPSKMSGRVNAAVYLTNVLGGVDQLLHGSEGLRGWGSQPFVDPVLLVPRGYDAATQRFRYEANPRFAETRATRVLTREPFRLSFDVNIRLHTNYDLQSLRRAIEPVRVNGRWERRGEDSLMAQYLRETSSLHKAMITESDSLFLSRDQIVKLQRADSVFGHGVRALYRPLANYLAGSGGEKVSKEALAMVDSTKKRYWRLFWQQPEIADSIVTPVQRDLMPMLKGMLETSQKDRLDSQWYFGSSVPLVHQRPEPPKP